MSGDGFLVTHAIALLQATIATRDNNNSVAICCCIWRSIYASELSEKYIKGYFSACLVYFYTSLTHFAPTFLV